MSSICACEELFLNNLINNYKSFKLIFIFSGYVIAHPINKTLRPVDGCACEKFSCGCCLYMDVPEIWLNDTGE